MGVKVLKFSLGFGPKLIGKKMGETEYQIAVFPLGGFVKPLGEDPTEEIKEEERHRSFWAQPIWKRALIIGAGPFFNFFLAIIFFSAINLFGIPYIPSKIGEVTAGLPAESAGLKKEDVILSIDGETISKWEELSTIIRNSKGKELSLKIKRDGEPIEIKVKPMVFKDKDLFGEEMETYRIGIINPKEILIEKVNPLTAVGLGFLQTWQSTKLMVVGIVKLIEGKVSAKTIGGPILIGQLAGEQARRGLLSFAAFIAFISINLGLINLFPIPILDGGHILFLGIEAILGRPVSIKKMEIAQQIGLILLILLMVFAFHNDIRRIFFPTGGYGF